MKTLILILTLAICSSGIAQVTTASFDETDTYRKISALGLWGIADSAGNIILPAKHKQISFVCNGMVVTQSDSVYLRTITDSVIAAYEFLPIDPDTFSKALYTCSIPDADLILRVLSLYTEPYPKTADSGMTYSKEAMAFCMSNPCLSCWLTEYTSNVPGLRKKIEENREWIKHYNELKSQGRIRGEEILPEKSKN